MCSLRGNASCVGVYAGYRYPSYPLDGAWHCNKSTALHFLRKINNFHGHWHRWESVVRILIGRSCMTERAVGIELFIFCLYIPNSSEPYLDAAAFKKVRGRLCILQEYSNRLCHPEIVYKNWFSSHFLLKLAVTPFVLLVLSFQSWIQNLQSFPILMVCNKYR